DPIATHPLHTCERAPSRRRRVGPLSVLGDDRSGLRLSRKHWDDAASAREAGSHRGWLDSALVLEEIFQPRVADERSKNWLIALCERIELPRNLRWLSLGCGTAGHELLAARLGLFATMEAVDLSPVSLSIARTAAAEARLESIEFAEGDLNRIEIPEASCDVVMMNMSLHHVENLERLLAQIDRALRPGGWLLLNEFVGPRQFQFPDVQLGIVERLLAALPERLRLDSTSGETKREYVRRPPSWWNQADPSEAIRSDQILLEVHRRFEVVDRRDYGGAVLHLLLEHIVQNFDPRREDDVCWMRVLGAVEALLQESGILASDFVVLAARKRPTVSQERPATGLSRLMALLSRTGRTRPATVEPSTVDSRSLR
ncbi:MAG: class I SAM-dependent methyltransferase, partial [Thermoanaerobaculia bacterium]